MGDFVKVATIGEIPSGEGRAFTVNGRRVAVFLQEGNYFAIDDICPHMGASLSEGYVEDLGVMCPWHAWKFCIKSGAWLDNPKSHIKSDTFEVRVLGNDIQVLVPDPPVRRPPA